MRIAHNEGMKSILIILLFFTYSCSQVSTRPAEDKDLVSVDAAIDHVRSSYLKGCVDAHHLLKIPQSFETCVMRAKEHEAEIRSILIHLLQVLSTLLLQVVT